MMRFPAQCALEQLAPAALSATRPGPVVAWASRHGCIHNSSDTDQIMGGTLMPPQTHGRDAPAIFQRILWSVVCPLASVLIILLLAGCSIPIPQAQRDPTRYYVLSTSGSPAATPAANGPVVHLRQVEVAHYLDARTIVVRRGPNEIQFREFARWGEPLDLGIGRVLREELLARGAASAVLAPGLRSSGVKYDQELRVRVLACEGGADGTVLFRAVWELFSAGMKPESLARGDFHAAGLRWDGKSEASLAAELSQAVGGLADEISAALRK